MDLEEIGRKAKTAKYRLQKASAEEKNRGLETAAELVLARREELLAANGEDVSRGEKSGMHPGMLDRLRLTEERIEAMAEGLLQIAGLPDCIGEAIERFRRPNGLLIEKRRVPMGVVGIIYESRPNVTTDAFGLCFKTGNAVILKGGSDALCSNKAIVGILQDALEQCRITRDAIQLITSTDRAVTNAFMKMKDSVDLLIPRGGAGLIKSVVENSTIPVIETGTGNCHVYVDKDADLDMAAQIVKNAKTQRIGVCNACESLVVHRDVADAFLPVLSQVLQPYRVRLRGDETACRLISSCKPASQEDYGREYLDYIMSVKTVYSAEEAIAHINRYNTGHSDCIVTENRQTAEQFLNEVDAACVYVNASTRFTDGFEFGFGAEIGISTQKLHARGPMGLKELTSYKYIIQGRGQVR